MLSVRWSATALEDVDAMATFIAQDNPAAADRMTDLVFEAAEKLGTAPYLYRSGREPGTREAVVHPNYIVVYAVQADAIRILRLLHARQQYPERPKPPLDHGRSGRLTSQQGSLGRARSKSSEKAAPGA